MTQAPRPGPESPPGPNSVKPGPALRSKTDWPAVTVSAAATAHESESESLGPGSTVTVARSLGRRRRSPISQPEAESQAGWGSPSLRLIGFWAAGA